MRRAATAGQPETATTIAVGILTGLQNLPDPADGSVLAWAGPDSLDDLAYRVLREADKLGIQIPVTLDAEA